MRRSARVAEAVERATVAFPLLPPVLGVAIFALLPITDRLRCREVCRAWRGTLRDPAAWAHCDISFRAGVPRELMPALLRAAVRASGGGIEALDVSGCHPQLIFGELLAALEACRGLRELRVCHRPMLEWDHPTALQVTQLLHAAGPSLREFHVDMCCQADNVCEALRGAAPFTPALRLHLLRVEYLLPEGDQEMDDPSVVLEFVEAAAAHATLEELEIFDSALDTAAALDAVTDLAINRRLHSLNMERCSLDRATALPAVARLLRGGALRSLQLQMEGHMLMGELADGVALAAALRDAPQLVGLELASCDFYGCAPAAEAVLAALTGHPGLRALYLVDQLDPEPADARRLGAALAATLAGSPQLRDLSLYGSPLPDAFMAPVVRALRAHRGLWRLDLGLVDMSAAFIRRSLTPAVRANAALRQLAVGEWDVHAFELVEFVAVRREAAERERPERVPGADADALAGLARLDSDMSALFS